MPIEITREWAIALGGAGVVTVLGRIAERLLEPYVNRAARRHATEELALKKEEVVRKDNADSRDFYIAQIERERARAEEERDRADEERAKRLTCEEHLSSARREIDALKLQAKDAENSLAHRERRVAQAMSMGQQENEGL